MAKYLHNSTFFGYTLKKGTSSVWQGIVKTKKILHKRFCFRFGDESSINIWLDPWLPGFPNKIPATKENISISS